MTNKPFAFRLRLLIGLQICSHAVVRCLQAAEGCRVLLLRANLSHHNSICPYYQVCCKICLQSVQRAQVTDFAARRSVVVWLLRPCTVYLLWLQKLIDAILSHSSRAMPRRIL